MKRICFFFLISVFAGPWLSAQEPEEQPVIPVNTQFVWKLETTDSIRYTCRLVKKEPYEEDIDLNDRRVILSAEVPDGYIHGIFGYGEFGRRRNCILLLKSGLDRPLSYRLVIKQSEAGQPAETSVLNLYPQLLSIELWPYAIEYAIPSDFETVEDTEEEEAEEAAPSEPAEDPAG